MAKRTGAGSGRSWKPETQGGRLALGKKWDPYLDVHAEELHMTAKEKTEQHDKVEAADTAVQAENLNPSDANKLKVRITDEALSEGMTYTKDHFLLSPPVSEEDCAYLGIPYTPKPTPRVSIKRATNQAAVTSHQDMGVHLIKVLMALVGMIPAGFKAWQYSFQVAFAVVDPLGASANAGDMWTTILKTPITGNDLPNMLQTHLKWLLINFSEADRGKVVWFSVRLVNAKGEAGDFGPMYSAVVP